MGVEGMIGFEVGAAVGAGVVESGEDERWSFLGLEVVIGVWGSRFGVGRGRPIRVGEGVFVDGGGAVAVVVGCWT